MFIQPTVMDDAANFLLHQFEPVFANTPVETDSFCIDAALREVRESVYTAVRIVRTPDRCSGIRIVSRYQSAVAYRRAKPMPQILTESQRCQVRKFSQIARELEMRMIAFPTTRALVFQLQPVRDYYPVVVPTSVELLFSRDQLPVFRSQEREAA